MNQIAPVTLSLYNPLWPGMFKDETEKLLSVIGAYITGIEHIGSTAITGAVAKPEVDIMVGVANLEGAQKCIKPLEGIGYVYFQRFEEFVPERRYLRKSDGITPLFHIHMVEQSSDFWREHILFRNLLRGNPELVKHYNELKEKLVNQFKGDRQEYSKGKEKFIFEVLKSHVS